MFPHIRQLNFPVILTAQFEEAYYITKYEDDLTIGKLGEVCVAISTPIWCSESKRLRRVNFHSTLVDNLSFCRLVILSTCHHRLGSLLPIWGPPLCSASPLIEVDHQMITSIIITYHPWPPSCSSLGITPCPLTSTQSSRFFKDLTHEMDRDALLVQGLLYQSLVIMLKGRFNNWMVILRKTFIVFITARLKNDLQIKRWFYNKNLHHLHHGEVDKGVEETVSSDSFCSRSSKTQVDALRKKKLEISCQKVESWN